MKYTDAPPPAVSGRLRTFVLLPLLVLVISTGCQQKQTERSFRFVFMTDSHVYDEMMAPEGFRAAVAHAETFDPDFVVTGGDLIMDALKVPLEDAVAQFDLYNQIIGAFDVPVYNALGNHDVFGLSPESGVAPEHPQYGKTLFKEMLGLESTYYSFDHLGWHFIVLDAMTPAEDRGYIGEIDAEQLTWIKNDLARTDPRTPITVVTHFPFVSVALQLREGGSAALPEAAVIVNSHEVFEMFEGHNLRLVLQGHLHIVEETIVGDVHFLIGGSISGKWWHGPNAGFAEGVVVVDVTGDDFSWRYETFGWRAAAAE